MPTKAEQLQAQIDQANLEIERLKGRLLTGIKGDAAAKNAQFIKNLQDATILPAPFCKVLGATLVHLDGQKNMAVENGVVSFSEVDGASSIARRLRWAFLNAPEFQRGQTRAQVPYVPTQPHVHPAYRGPVYERD